MQPPGPTARRLKATDPRHTGSHVMLAVALGASLAFAGCGITSDGRAPGADIASFPVETPFVPQPTPTPDGHDEAVAAFVEGTTGGKLSYRVKLAGQVAASADVLPIAGSMDVSGRDFASSFTYDFEPEYPGQGVGKQKVQVRGIKDKGWIKLAGKAWKPVKGYGVEDSYVPFKGITAAKDLRYLGPAEVDGKTYFKVAVPGALLIHPRTIPYQIQKEEVDQTTLEVLIDEQGRPRLGTWRLIGKARIGEGVGQLQRVVYDLDLTFSKVGDKLTIKRP